MAKICPECGANVNEIAKVCYTCGAKLVGETQKSSIDIPPSMDNVLPLDMNDSSSAGSDSISRDFEKAINSTYKRDTESGYIPSNLKFDNPAIKEDDDRKAIFFVLVGISIAIVIALIMLFTMEPKDNNKKNDDIPAGNSVTTSANAGSNNSKLYSKLAEPVQDYYDGLKKGDFDKVMATYPPVVEKVIVAENKAYGESEEDYINWILDSYSEDGIDLKNDIIEVSITSATPYTGDKLDELESYYEELYGVELDLKEAYYSDVIHDVLSNGQSTTFTNACIIVNVSGKWYYLD